MKIRNTVKTILFVVLLSVVILTLVACVGETPHYFLSLAQRHSGTQLKKATQGFPVTL
jgi:hypothetical protein